jgi:hypothetical protein
MTDFTMVHKPHKMLDWLEGEVTDWAFGLVQEHFGVEDTSELSEEQIQVVVEEWSMLDDADMGYDWLAMGFRNVIGSWENENDNYII